jgi:hypothetical protein
MPNNLRPNLLLALLRIVDEHRIRADGLEAAALELGKAWGLEVVRDADMPGGWRIAQPARPGASTEPQDFEAREAERNRLDREERERRRGGT